MSVDNYINTSINIEHYKIGDTLMMDGVRLKVVKDSSKKCGGCDGCVFLDDDHESCNVPMEISLKNICSFYGYIYRKATFNSLKKYL